MPNMRTTLTLEPDVAEKLKREADLHQKSFKETVNTALKRGLGITQPKRKKPFRVKPRAMGLVAGVDALHLNRLADDLEVEAWKDKQPR